MKCLLLYYSFTAQAERIAALAAQECIANNWEPTLCRIDFADPAQRLVRPLSIATTKKWVEAADKGAIYPVICSPEAAIGGDYDLVLILTNTWQDSPCTPIRSFMESPDAARALYDRPFGVFVICRRLWQKNLSIIRTLGEKAGGRFIGGEPFMHPGSEIGSLIQTITYTRRTDTGRKSILGFPLPAYGLSAEALARAPTFTRSLLNQAARHPIDIAAS